MGQAKEVLILSYLDFWNGNKKYTANSSAKMVPKNIKMPISKRHNALYKTDKWENVLTQQGDMASELLSRDHVARY